MSTLLMRIGMQLWCKEPHMLNEPTARKKRTEQMEIRFINDIGMLSLTNSCEMRLIVYQAKRAL